MRITVFDVNVDVCWSSLGSYIITIQWLECIVFIKECYVQYKPGLNFYHPQEIVNVYD